MQKHLATPKDTIRGVSGGSVSQLHASARLPGQAESCRACVFADRRRRRLQIAALAL